MLREPAIIHRRQQFPAGLIDEGESPEQAALRELKEETGRLGQPHSPVKGLFLLQSPFPLVMCKSPNLSKRPQTARRAQLLENNSSVWCAEKLFLPSRLLWKSCGRLTDWLQ